MAKATVDTAQRSMDVLQDVYAEISNSVTIYAIGTNQIWPYVTYPYWNETASHAQAVTTTSVTSIATIIQNPLEWVKYTQEQGAVTPVVWELIDSQPVPLFESGDYAPNWQMSVQSVEAKGYEKLFVNLNMYSVAAFSSMAKHVLNFHQGIVSGFIKSPTIDPKYFRGLPGTSRGLAVTTPIDSKGQRTGTKAYELFPESSPLSIFGQPIFDSFTPNASIVGYVQGYITWNNYFNNVLLKEDEGIYVVLSNSCNEVRTWLVKANFFQYLGKVGYDAI
jgi:hypothetical protein